MNAWSDFQKGRRGEVLVTISEGRLAMVKNALAASSKGDVLIEFQGVFSSDFHY